MTDEGASANHDMTYDVVVVGAGPTGLTLANLLGAAGVKTLLVEANTATVGEPRAVSIDDESLRTVQAMGLLDTVGPSIVGGYGSEYRSPSGRVFLRVKPQGQPYGHPRRNAFRQPVFEAQLRGGVARYHNVSTLFECRLERFEQDAEHVMLELSTREGGVRRVHAGFLVGCDGARSGVRAALGAALIGDSANERWLIVDLTNSPAPSRETIVFCNARRPGIALPGPDNTRRYEFKVMPWDDEVAMLADDNVALLLAAHGAAPGSEIVRKTVYHFHARLTDSWGKGRVWLAGDAAHLSPPFAGQGMNSGVRDALNIAWKLAEVVRGTMGLQLLDTYPSERHGHVGEMIRLARRMGAIMGPRTRLHGAMHRAAFWLLGLYPAARSYFAEMKYKPQPRFRTGFVLRPRSERGSPVGRLTPQPRLRAGPDEGKLLDELLGARFALLAIGLNDTTVQQLSLGSDFDCLLDCRVALPVDWVPELAGYAGKLLLLRPDHFVMACFAPEEIDSVVRELDALVERTWEEKST